MTEADAAMQIGQAVGLILTAAVSVPAAIAAPVVAIFGLGSFLFGKKYERKWNKKRGLYEPYGYPQPYEIETPESVENEQ